MIRTSETLIKTLQILKEQGPLKLADLSKALKKEESSTIHMVPVIMMLKELGFIRAVSAADMPVSEVIYEITKTGKAFLKYAKTSGKPIREEINAYLVLTVPKYALTGTHENILETKEVLETLLIQANEEVLIMSPYIDASLIPFLERIKEHVKTYILLSDIDEKLLNSLKRLKENKLTHLKLGLTHLYDGRSQVFQLHAKCICVDKENVFITSANLKETSIYHNIELGVVFLDRRIAEQVRDIFFAIFNSKALTEIIL